jgi:hypothetical protein
MSKKGGDSQVVGFRYFMDILMGLSRGPVDSVPTIKVGDIVALEHDQRANGSVLISKPDMFGGDQGEGGIAGYLTYLFGYPGQIVSDAIKNAIASNGSNEYSYYGGSLASNIDQDKRKKISDFRGVTSLFFTGQICSNNPYPKVWKIRQRRALTGWGVHGPWYPEKAAITYRDQATGSWDAYDNVPQLFSGVEDSQQVRTVIVAGLTTIDGISNWQIGQKIAWNSKTNKWEQLGADDLTVVSMNPAHILYQCITDSSWGRGQARSEIDNESFVYAANYLWEEKFGLSLRWSAKDADLNTFIQTIVDHISAVLYIDRGTGLTVLRLIRQDYDVLKIPYFDYASGLLSVDTQETGSALVTANEIIVNWHDPILDIDRQSRAQNLGGIQSSGSVLSQSRDYPGICNQDIASRVAVRELTAGSAGLKKFRLKFDRRAWRLQPGHVLTISAPDKGIERVILRVLTYDDGTLVDGTITMDAMQDVFGMPATTYTTPVDSTWVKPPSGEAPELIRSAAQEASYYELARGLSETDLGLVGETEGGFYGVAGSPTTTSSSLVMKATPAGGDVTQTFGAFCPVGVLAEDLGPYTTDFSLAAGTELAGIAPPMTGLIGNEAVQVTSFSVATGVGTLARGGTDTIPAKHPAGSSIFVHDVNRSVKSRLYEQSEVVTMMLQAKINTGVSDPSTAPVYTIKTDARHNRPFVMGDLRLNGLPAISDSSIVVRETATYTWVSRNRLTQFDQFVAHGAGPVAAEAGTTYTVEVRNAKTGALRRSHTGITASTYTYNAAEAALGGGDPPDLRFTIYSVRSGIASFNKYNILMTYVGDGVGVLRSTGKGTMAAYNTSLRNSELRAAGIGIMDARSATIGIIEATLTASGMGEMNGVGIAGGTAAGALFASGTGVMDARSDAVSASAATMSGTGTLTATIPVGYDEYYGFGYGGTT